jgi:hypothetical protein
MRRGTDARESTPRRPREKRQRCAAGCRDRRGTRAGRSASHRVAPPGAGLRTAVARGCVHRPATADPCTCTAPSFGIAASMALTVGRVAWRSCRRWMALSMREMLWYTTRPEPRLMWPTSELPNCPSGRPTSTPEPDRSACAVLRARAGPRSVCGAWAMALSRGSSRWPKPSRITSTTGPCACSCMMDSGSGFVGPGCPPGEIKAALFVAPILTSAAVPCTVAALAWVAVPMVTTVR